MRFLLTTYQLHDKINLVMKYAKTSQKAEQYSNLSRYASRNKSATDFEDNEDYAKFIQIIRDCKSLSGFQLFAYCLMENHKKEIETQNKKRRQERYKQEQREQFGRWK
jgi:hypothetical protein